MPDTTLPATCTACGAGLPAGVRSRLVHEFLRPVTRGNVLALDGGAAPR